MTKGIRAAPWLNVAGWVELRNRRNREAHPYLRGRTGRENGSTGSNVVRLQLLKQPKSISKQLKELRKEAKKMQAAVR
jgi:hypothetical protein